MAVSDGQDIETATRAAVSKNAAPDLERYLALRDVGDRQGALHAASEACHAAPDDGRSHYAYGEAWAALGEPANAERAFAAALRLAPEWADAWVNFGIARYRQGAIDDAKLAMRHALRHVSDHAAAAANLGAFLRLTGDGELGEQLLRDAIARDPTNSAARLNLAADLLQDERSDEALALLDAVAAPADSLAARHHHLARALAHLQQGRATEGRAALDDCAVLGPIPPSLAPLWHWRNLLLALAEGDEREALAEAERAETALAVMGPEAVPEHRIMTHYDLAKFWSGRGAHARAFAFWAAAHRLLAVSQPFSRDAHRAFLDANIATFTRARFARGARARNSDPTPVFIVGMPRSGTTLCEQILAAHRDVHGAGERGALGEAFGSATPEAVARLATLGTAALSTMADAYLAELHALAPEKARIVDKMPGNYLRLALVGLMLPGARIIHCVRDPRDIGLSIFTFRFHGVHPYAHDLGDLGWTIAQQTHLMVHWKHALPNRVLTVALADWVADFDGTLARVLAHLDLPPDSACARFHEQESRVRTASRAQVRQPINARGLGRWRRYADELAPLIAEIEAADAAHRSRDSTGLTILHVDDPARAMGLAVDFLMTKPAFANLRFGNWAQILSGQIERGDFRFIADGSGRICGLVGWAMTNQAAAEEWVFERRAVSSAECRGGEHVIINVWSADTAGVHRFLVDALRPTFVRAKMFYFKRYYPDGRIRPMRLPATDFLRNHIARAASRQRSPSAAD